MTKNKRYKLSELFSKQIIQDDGEVLTQYEVVDLLNEQYNEIQRCKLAYNQLSSYVDVNFDEYMTQKKLNERIKELKIENEQLKQDRFICLDCRYCGHTEIGCLCEKQDHWEDFKSECNDFKELKYYDGDVE